ncbi:MAG: hypothetical protein VYA26_06530 [Actinomycetota bacterium]|nr:hypothetical protein [Actinomycetota bacterium]
MNHDRAGRTVHWNLHQPAGRDGPTVISSWVVYGRLAMGYYPGMIRYPEMIRPKAAPETLDELLDSGIDQFVNLTQDSEGGTDAHLTPYYQLSEHPDGPSLVSVGRHEGEQINVALRPVPDEHLPDCDKKGRWSCEIDGYGEDLVSCGGGQPVPATRLILDDLDDFLQQGRNVYVHCWGGSGRTGTIVGCWIRRHGLADADEVLNCLASLREGDSVKHGRPIPQTAAQEQLVLDWEPGW